MHGLQLQDKVLYIELSTGTQVCAQCTCVRMHTYRRRTRHSHTGSSCSSRLTLHHAAILIACARKSGQFDRDRTMALPARYN